MINICYSYDQSSKFWVSKSKARHKSMDMRPGVVNVPIVLLIQTNLKLTTQIFLQLQS